jgi:hypothetical protein
MNDAAAEVMGVETEKGTARRRDEIEKLRRSVEGRDVAGELARKHQAEDRLAPFGVPSDLLDGAGHHEVHPIGRFTRERQHVAGAERTRNGPAEKSLSVGTWERIEE